MTTFGMNPTLLATIVLIFSPLQVFCMQPGGRSLRRTVSQRKNNVYNVATRDPCLGLGLQHRQHYSSWDEIDNASKICKDALDDLQSLDEALKAPCATASGARCYSVKRASGEWFACRVKKPRCCALCSTEVGFSYCASRVTAERDGNGAQGYGDRDIIGRLAVGGPHGHDEGGRH